MVNSISEHAKQAAIGCWFVLRRPPWAALAVLLGFIVSIVIYLSINFGFYGSLLGSQLSVIDKLYALVVMMGSMVVSYADGVSGLLLLIVSLLQGAAMSMLIFTARRNRKMDAGVVGRSGLALVFATLGLGCVPCGTSLLVPVMTIVFSSSAPAMLGTANTIVLILAIGLTIFSLYKIGKIAYKYQIAEV